MDIEVRRAEYRDVEAMRELYRQEAGCQVVRDSILRRGLADPYLILAQGRPAGYGGVWTRHHPGRIMEFHTLPHVRASALPMFRALLATSGATHVEAQTNMPLMLLMLHDCAQDIRAENLLFEDAYRTDLACPGAVFRRARPGEPSPDPTAEWVVESGGAVVAAGGFLTHYNPPYADVFMTVAEQARLQGFGSYLVQECKRVCYEAGRRPAARCRPDNLASRRTLQKAGLLPCGRLLVGEVVPAGG